MNLFLRYSFVSNAEKALVFFFPIFILHALGVESYAKIEYIFALAGIGAVIFDFGFRSYIIYAELSPSNLKKNNEARYAYRHISASLAVLGLIIFLIALWTTNSFLLETSAGWSRALYLACTAVRTTTCRLDEKPTNIFRLSIPINLLFIACAWLLKDSGEIFLHALVVLHIAGAISIAGTPRANVNLSQIYTTAAESLRYAWPTVLSLLIFSYISSYGKIYAATHLSQHELYIFSLAQRFALLAQIAHATYIGFCLKSIYETNCRKKTLTHATKYFLTILCGMTVGILGLHISNINQPELSKTEQIQVGLVFLYTILWCTGSYLEIYHNRQNKNSNILLGMLSWLAVFEVTIHFGKTENGTTLDTIALAMVLGAASNILFSATRLVLTQHR